MTFSFSLSAAAAARNLLQIEHAPDRRRLQKAKTYMKDSDRHRKVASASDIEAQGVPDSVEQLEIV